MAEENKITKQQLADFARIVKNGNVGHYYTLYTDGSYNEAVDPYTTVVGKKMCIARQCQKGDTVKLILQQFVDQLAEEESMIKEYCESLK